MSGWPRSISMCAFIAIAFPNTRISSFFQRSWSTSFSAFLRYSARCLAFLSFGSAGISSASRSSSSTSSIATMHQRSSGSGFESRLPYICTASSNFFSRTQICAQRKPLST